MRQAQQEYTKSLDDVDANIESFGRHLRVAVAPTTRKVYVEAVLFLAKFLKAKGMPQI